MKSERDRARDVEKRAFTAPASLEEAESEDSRLVGVIREIERKLPLENNPEARSFKRYALERKIARLHLIREWVADERNRLRAGIVEGEPLDPGNPTSLLRRALFLLRAWAPGRVSIKDDEWAVINSVERYVMRR